MSEDASIRFRFLTFDELTTAFKRLGASGASFSEIATNLRRLAEAVREGERPRADR